MWSFVAGWQTAEDGGGLYLGGVHAAFLGPGQLGFDISLLLPPQLIGGDGLGFTSDLGLSLPMRLSSGSLLVPRIGVSLLLLLPVLGGAGTHAGFGLVVPDRGGSAGIRFDAVLLDYVQSSALRLTVGITSLPDWLAR